MESQGADFAFLILMVFVQIPFAVVSYLTAKRKGRGPGLFAIGGLIPLFGAALLFYLIGIADKDIYDRLDRIEKQLAS